MQLFCREKKLWIKRVNVCMQLICANRFPVCHQPTDSTLPSEHSIAPEIWTDILGAFSQEQKQIIAKKY